jgi:hypothetical protein
MPWCVRKLGSKTLWDDPTPEEADWLSPNDLRADALRDLETEQNTLSIFEVDEGSGISASRILAAMAARCSNLAKADFVVFDSAIFGELGIALERVEGETFDAGVNARHMNLVQLTAGKLADFGSRIRSGGDKKRYTKKDVRELIRDSVARGFIDASQLTPDVRKHIDT